jgi:protein-S-isoprenylcysteine O-methyltransferase Ste14
MNEPRKYVVVRVIAALLKIVAVIILILGIVALVASLGMGNRIQLPQWLTLGGAVAAPLVALVTFVQLYAFGSILSLLVKIEENTRAMLQPPSEG